MTRPKTKKRPRPDPPWVAQLATVRQRVEDIWRETQAMIGRVENAVRELRERTPFCLNGQPHDPHLQHDVGAHGTICPGLPSPAPRAFVQAKAWCSIPGPHQPHAASSEPAPGESATFWTCDGKRRG